MMILLIFFGSSRIDCISIDLALQLAGLLGALEDVFPVDVPQLDLCHILGLRLVDAEADHQVGHDLLLLTRSRG